MFRTCVYVINEKVLKVFSRSHAFYASYLRKTMGSPFDPPPPRTTSARVKKDTGIKKKKTFINSLTPHSAMHVLKWAVPGSSARPGQPVAGQEQAPVTRQSSKISLIFWSPCRRRIRY